MALRNLYLGCTSITSSCSKKLFQNFKSNPILRIIKLDRNNFVSNEILFYFPELVSPFSRLTHLNFSECSFSDKIGEAFFEAMSENSSIKAVWLTKNLLGQLTAESLRKCLLSSVIKLQTLDLSINRLNDAAAQSIALGLKGNLSLVFLNLGTNSILSEGAQHLAEAIKYNSRIEKIILKFNSVSEKLVQTIDEKTAFNAVKSKRRKLPFYKREIKSIVVKQEMIDEAEWKTEQTRQRREGLEQELGTQYEKFEIFQKKRGRQISCNQKAV
eukprot:TRINITY_DN58033_c0_g1_i2.p1 TRINITY_DN58033_c0_g1~~TRINITY_DN58033_c0_g1_i2.p1  ORF type:complete len:271 (+),score=25.64 TRINITY_DN58033_c0_g1_i2:949-1761(+)